MTTTYDPNLSTTTDQIRLYLGDTDIASAIFSNEEIVAIYAMEKTTLSAAAALASSAAARYARRVSTSIDGLSVQYSDMAKGFAALATRLRQQMTEGPGGLGQPAVEGVSVSEMDAVNSDIDRNPSRFRMGQDDNPGTGVPDPVRGVP